jgi:hypothetical protein
LIPQKKVEKPNPLTNAGDDVNETIGLLKGDPMFRANKKHLQSAMHKGTLGRRLLSRVLSVSR